MAVTRTGLWSKQPGARTVFALALCALLLAATGCSNDAARAGCPAAQLLEPKTDHCATPRTKEDVYRMEGYTELARLPREEPVAAVVSLQQWMSLDDLVELLDATDVSELEEVHIELRGPAADSTMTVELPAGTRVAGLEDALFAQLAKSFGDAWIDQKFTRLRDVLPSLRKSGDYRFGIVTIEFKSAEGARNWWRSNVKAIRILSPLQSELDRAMSTFRPNEEVE